MRLRSILWIKQAKVTVKYQKHFAQGCSECLWWDTVTLCPASLTCPAQTLMLASGKTPKSCMVKTVIYNTWRHHFHTQQLACSITIKTVPPSKKIPIWETQKSTESPSAALRTSHVCQRRWAAAAWHHKRVLKEHELFEACILFSAWIYVKSLMNRS